MIIPGFIGGAYQAQSPAVSNEVCRNLYPESAAEGAALYSTPGLAARYVLGVSPVRSLFHSNGRCFCIMGNKLFELFADLTSIERGVVANDNRPVKIVSNRFQLCFVSAGTTYLYDLAADALVTVPNVNLSQVRFADGYFIGLTRDSQMICLSGQYDGATWDPLDFTSAEGDPDDIIAIEADHREIWTFGTQSIEPFKDTGAPDMPYERVDGALIEQGCGAADSVVKADNALFWFGRSSLGEGMFWRAEGYTPLRISTYAVEYQISKYATVSDCIGYSYQEAGHTFCVWHFPTADKTWVYDVGTRLWHERASWDQVAGVWRRHRAQVHCHAFGMHLVGDYETGIVYEQSIELHDDAGQPRRWVRGALIGNVENKYLFSANFELHMEVGTGVPGGAAPKVVMRYSKDGGYTFGNERVREAGRIGQYAYRCRWAGPLGQARIPYVEVSGSDPVRIALKAAYIDVIGGTA